MFFKILHLFENKEKEVKFNGVLYSIELYSRLSNQIVISHI